MEGLAGRTPAGWGQLWGEAAAWQPALGFRPALRRWTPARVHAWVRAGPWCVSCSEAGQDPCRTAAQPMGMLWFVLVSRTYMQCRV